MLLIILLGKEIYSDHLKNVFIVLYLWADSGGIVLWTVYTRVNSVINIIDD